MNDLHSIIYEIFSLAFKLFTKNMIIFYGGINMYIRLPLQGTKNTRDLGGYPTPLGVTKFNLIYRSDNLKYLTESDQARLNALNIKHVIDLRHELERIKAPSGISSNITVSEISLIEDLYEATSEDFYKNVKLADLYIQLLDQAQTIIKHILEIIINSKTPILFHCTAGKDRTGLISMLLMGILGVSDEDIVAQYQVSQTYLNERHDLYDINESDSKVLIESDPKHMFKTLQYFYDKYESFEAYFDVLGIDQTQINRFKNKMVMKEDNL